MSIIINMAILSGPVTSLADESNSEKVSEIDITLSPSDVLFDIDNMKPGDWAPRSIVIQNSGKFDFNYQMSVQNEGSERLFNEFLLEIKDDSDELYNGKLADFERLPIRELEASSEEELEIIVRYPEHLGNEFQGLDSQFTFIFTAEGTEDTDINDRDEENIESSVGSDDDANGTGSGSALPNTATNMFNIVLIGSILLGMGVIIAAASAIKKIRNNKQHI
ncbi:hypothetical protein GMD78_11865 [Ornithinibacillus sp. L9]|uniref:LPXTG-motif cell wall anchor domain-containing protein n=1 Tax=Ornithinibacillus caprae TaxID=2678566 RepID=A0A6N8FHL0_9BACI|nr:hypothetical protein [Ornithinibacillus caprae]